jgi:hypothetical protein
MVPTALIEKRRAARNKCRVPALVQPGNTDGLKLTQSCRVAKHEHQNVSTETPELSQPGMAERAIDAATDVSRSITDATEALQAAVNRLGQAITTARQPGKPLATISAITREAPLASLFVAFLFGIAVARRR